MPAGERRTEHLGDTEIDHELPAADIGGLGVADLAFNIKQDPGNGNPGPVQPPLVNLVTGVIGKIRVEITAVGFATDGRLPGTERRVIST